MPELALRAPSGRGAGVEPEATTRAVRVEPVMGTVVSVDVRDPGEWSAAMDLVVAWFHRVDAVFSTFRPDSQVSRLGRGEIGEAECDADVREVLALCAEVAATSRGCFDIRAGGRLDPSALVKGWSVERAAAMLRRAGARHFFIAAGGDVVAAGGAAPGRPWRVGIRHPERGDRVAAVLAVSDLAVATSGAYERGAHIIDPRSGLPANGDLLSMTVTGPSLTYADALATAAFVMGEAGAAWVPERRGYDAFAVTRDRRSVWTPGLDAVLVR